MSSSRLNKKQELFIQNLLKGMSQRDAYKNAFNCRYADSAIDSNASKLLKMEKIKSRYEYLANEALKRIEEDSILSAQERMIYLSKIVRGEKIDNSGKIANVESRIKAIDTLNKMTGEYSKIDINLNCDKLEDVL